jgi:uncharacterized membrane protein YkoI
MKKLFLVTAVTAIFSLNFCGQTSKDVPPNVKTAFSQKFPSATNVKWDMENEKEWEAEFKMDGKEYSANFDMNATWMETEYEISTTEIPVSVKTTIDKEFAGYKIEKSEVSETADGKVYEFELKKDAEKIEIAIDMNGKVVKKEQMKKQGEEGEDVSNYENGKLVDKEGSFENCIKTEDWNALEPDAPIEFKYYAPGIGVIKEEAEDGSEVVELITIAIQ